MTARAAARWVLVAAFSLLLGVSGIVKVMDTDRVLSILHRLYNGYPDMVYPAVMWLVIVAELSAAVLVWIKRFRPFAAMIILLLAWFFLMVHLRILLFFPYLDCGCFGRLFNRPPGFKTLAENLILLVASGFFLWLVRPGGDAKPRAVKLEVGA